MRASADALARLERHVGRLLVTGVAASATALALGLVAFLWASGSSAASTLLTAGLVILMATPILRVAVSVIEYVRMRDWFFALITVAVLIELAVTVLYALGYAPTLSPGVVP